MQFLGERHVKTPSLSIVLKEWGEPEAPKLLALHGWLDNAASFDYLFSELSGLHAMAMDLPGHGQSQHLPEGYRYHLLDFVEWIIEVADALAWQRFHLLGHSLGAGIASLIASSFPGRIESLILLDGIGPLSEDLHRGPARLAEAVNSIRDRSNTPRRTYPDVESASKAREKANNLDREQVKPLVERSLVKVENGYTWRFDPKLLLPSLQYFTEPQVLSFLSEIKAPTLLIEAEQGLLNRHVIVQRRMRQISHLQHQIMPGQHHFHLQHPQQVAAVIDDYLASIK